MKLPRLSDDEFARICARLDDGSANRDDLRSATVHLLGLLEERAPGNSVEVRVPPFAVTQCIAGSQHTRGTPPAVVEMDASTWVSVARGHTAWASAGISASGQRSDLSALMPLA